MIITVSPREQRGDIVNNFYSFNAGLKNSVEKNLLEKKIIEKKRVDSLLEIVNETSAEGQNDSLEDNDESEQLPIPQSR